MKREAEVRPGAHDRGIVGVVQQGTVAEAVKRGIEPGLCYHAGLLMRPKENTYHWAIPPLDKRAPHGGVLGWVAYKHIFSHIPSSRKWLPASLSSPLAASIGSASHPHKQRYTHSIRIRRDRQLFNAHPDQLWWLRNQSPPVKF